MKNGENVLIIGAHSIASALSNPRRQNHRLLINSNRYSPTEINQLLKNAVNLKDYKVIDKARFNKEAQALLTSNGFKMDRVPNSMILESDLHNIYDSSQFSPEHKRIIVLDGVTDIHNIGAIYRTVAFMGIDALVMNNPGQTLNPTFYRISSGANDVCPIYVTKSLSRFLNKIKKNEAFLLIGTSDKSENSIFNHTVGSYTDSKLCLIMGAEDKGISNAVNRCVDHFYSWPSSNPQSVSSLNVSVATALFASKLFL